MTEKPLLFSEGREESLSDRCPQEHETTCWQQRWSRRVPREAARLLLPHPATRSRRKEKVDELKFYLQSAQKHHELYTARHSHTHSHAPCTDRERRVPLCSSLRYCDGSNRKKRNAGILAQELGHSPGICGFRSEGITL